MNYRCPYCGRDTTITDPNRYSFWNRLFVQEPTLGEAGFGGFVITCPNKECKKMKLVAELTGLTNTGGRSQKIIQRWQLLPESEAKVLPDYVPMPIAEDYYEACRIRDLSPKASATLSRRCLQGMIRDFHGIARDTLFQEVQELEEKIEQDVWDSIDAVREVGNIGAHMKKDINLIVEVEPEEAQLLIGLIEQLVEEWYVTREDRKKRAESLKNLAASKKNSK